MTHDCISLLGTSLVTFPSQQWSGTGQEPEGSLRKRVVSKRVGKNTHKRNEEGILTVSVTDPELSPGPNQPLLWCQSSEDGR